MYGSRAREDFTSTSDYDIAGIRNTGEVQRIARFDETHRVYHDIFIYPENAFDAISDEHLCMSDGVVLVEQANFGTQLLKKLSTAISSYESITPDEIAVRKIWYQKMFARASIRDLEGKYRHIWSIFTILEDYFVFKGLRYQGPKKAFQYLKAHDPDTLSLFDAVLSNTNNLDSLQKLIKKITQ